MVMTLEADYAVRIVEYLTKHPERRDAKTISEETQIPLRFSLKILRELVAEGLVCSFKGAKGGYTLAKSPEEITLRQVIELRPEGRVELRPGALPPAQHLREDFRGCPAGAGILHLRHDLRAQTLLLLRGRGGNIKKEQARNAIVFRACFLPGGEGDAARETKNSAGKAETLQTPLDKENCLHYTSILHHHG